MNYIDDFFANILRAHLDEPTSVTLHVEGQHEGIPAIVVPKIDSAGRLKLDFYEVDSVKAVQLARSSQSLKPVTVQFQDSQSIESMVTRISMLGFEKGSLAVSVPEVSHNDSPIKIATFALIDFPMFFGQATRTVSTVYSDNPDYPGWKLLGKARLKSGGWEINIFESTEDNDYGITHTGHIVREDGREFSVDDLRNFARVLGYFLTFVLGVYRQPAVILARNSGYSYVWGRFNGLKQDKYVGDNWFELSRGESMETLFPGFLTYFREHEDEVSKCIEYYAESSMIAHIGLHKTALNESQSALEGISALVLGRRKEYKESARGFCGEALESLDINHELSEFPYLLEMWQRNHKRGTDDDSGLSLISRLRNQSIHLQFISSDLSEYYYAWVLCQRYVELLLLKLFQYTGDSWDRLRSMRVDSAPANNSSL